MRCSLPLKYFFLMVKLQCVFLEKNQKSHGRGWTLSVEKSHKIDFWLLMFFWKKSKIKFIFLQNNRPPHPPTKFMSSSLNKWAFQIARPEFCWGVWGAIFEISNFLKKRKPGHRFKNFFWKLFWVFLQIPNRMTKCNFEKIFHCSSTKYFFEITFCHPILYL